MKNQKGITLVALVITIAIMLILAGVTISVSLKGGLFSRANEATSEMQIAAEKEQLLTVALGTLGRNGKVNLEELDSNLPTGFEKIGTGTYKSSTGNKYQVTEDADIILLDGTEEEPDVPDTPVVPPVTPTITLSTTQISEEITNGTPETVTLTATLNDASGDLTWTSSDTGVAEISGNGTTRTITLKKAGTAVITVKYGTEATATCNITVTENTVEMATVTITVENDGGTYAYLSIVTDVITYNSISSAYTIELPVGSVLYAMGYSDGEASELHSLGYPASSTDFLNIVNEPYSLFDDLSLDTFPLILFDNGFPYLRINGKEQACYYLNEIEITGDMEIYCFSD